MISDDTAARLLAAISAVVGLVVMMTRSAPSWDGVLIGLVCLLGWAAFTRASQRATATRSKRVQGAPTPVDRPEEAPGTHPALLRGVVTAPTRLPDVPTHRQRVVERQALRSR